MRKFLSISLSLFVIIVLVSCSLDVNSGRLTPPSWIKGTWSDSYGIITATFTNSNFSVKNSGSTIDYSSFVKMREVKLKDQVSTNNTYSITMEVEGDLTQSLTFDRGNGSYIYYSVKTGPITSGPIILYKR